MSPRTAVRPVTFKLVNAVVLPTLPAKRMPAPVPVELRLSAWAPLIVELKLIEPFIADRLPVLPAKVTGPLNVSAPVLVNVVPEAIVAVVFGAVVKPDKPVQLLLRVMPLLMASVNA